MSAKPCPFRAVGFTAAAADFPLSHAGQLVVAAHNGVTVDKMPEAFRFAPNAGMKRWLEALGELLIAGACVRDDDGRWWTMARLEAAYPHCAAQVVTGISEHGHSLDRPIPSALGGGG